VVDSGFCLSFNISSVELVAFPLGSNFGVEFPSISWSVKFTKLSPTVGCGHFEIKTNKTRRMKFLSGKNTGHLSHLYHSFSKSLNFFVCQLFFNNFFSLKSYNYLNLPWINRILPILINRKVLGFNVSEDVSFQGLVKILESSYHLGYDKGNDDFYYIDETGAEFICPYL